MGRPHSPQRRASRIAHHVRVRDGLAASRLHAAGRKHRASHPATAPRHDRLIVADQAPRFLTRWSSTKAICSTQPSQHLDDSERGRNGARERSSGCCYG
jgi:hypothetical protein